MNCKKQRFPAIVLSVLLLFTLITLQPGYALSAGGADDKEIIIHYHRSDGNYEGWNIWAWPDGKDGAAYPFTGEDDYGVYAEITVPDADNIIGFIVRTDSWAKDPDGDRFINLSEGNEIWTITGRMEFFYEPPDLGQLPEQVQPASDYFLSEEFVQMYTYDGELGAIYTTAGTTFRLWAPTADTAVLNLYPSGNGSEASEKQLMENIGQGVWETSLSGDLHGIYYTYTVSIDGRQQEAIDPYARAAGVNGVRGMVVDLERTNPEGWNSGAAPPFENPVDAVIYELHVRDFSTADSSGMVNKGKYLAFTETGTVNPDGLSTGVDHLKELGVTHIHLLPVFDFRSIDETKLEQNNFNWGYDPENYNLPEGSYSTDPYDGTVRIYEFKQMVQSLHNNGLRVVMDVVYNHTGASTGSNLNRLVPDYYYRQNAAGGFSDGSGCGNETASERPMVRKLIVDSVVYWATEYNIDGFRFDLMGLHDIETMNAVRAALDEVDPSILIYGEGWTGGSSPLPESERAIKQNTRMLDNRIAVFSDDMRDGIKGHVFTARQPGYVNGDFGKREDVKFGIAASVEHPQIDYNRVSYSNAPWANEPTQTVNYASAHDNLTLWDKLSVTRPEASEEELIAMNKLSALFVLTSQGIPFIHAGEEFARSKDGDENSYKSPDSVNQLRWENKTLYNDLFEYYRGLIALRKSNPAFRLQTADEIASAIEFLNTEAQVLAYIINGDITGRNTIAVAVNVDNKERTVTLPQSGWGILADGKRAGTEIIGLLDSDVLTLPPKTGYVLEYTGFVESEPVPSEDISVEPGDIAETPQESDSGSGASDRFWLGVLIGGAGAVGIREAVGFIIRRRKRSA